MGTGFLPAHMLFWRWFGELSWLLPPAMIIFFLLSLRFERFSKVSTILALAMGQLAFVTLYAVCCAFLFSHTLLNNG